MSSGATPSTRVHSVAFNRVCSEGQWSYDALTVPFSDALNAGATHMITRVLKKCLLKKEAPPSLETFEAQYFEHYKLNRKATSRVLHRLVLENHEKRPEIRHPRRCVRRNDRCDDL